jgi:hypothetical protein
MAQQHKIFKPLFWTVLIGLLVFMVALGTPVLSRVVSGHVLAAAGCTSAGFDLQAQCPPDSFANRFIPFAHWLTTFVTPYLLVRQFWDVLLAWAGVALVLRFLAASPDADSKRTRL